MASMAVDILNLAGVKPRSILIFGPGLSKDHAQLALRYPDMQVSITDIGNFQDDSNFVPLENPQQFDVVIACEVAEHFVDVGKDFGSLLSKVSKDGIAVLSTNINDGTDPSNHEYAFIPGHTSYYSGAALASIVQRIDTDMQVDFRIPHAAFGQLGPRKRYVLINRANVRPGIALYFATHLLAPSEARYVRLGIARKLGWLKRIWARRRGN
jgi:SAM-dependent methyltransferase